MTKAAGCQWQGKQQGDTTVESAAVEDAGLEPQHAHWSTAKLVEQPQTGKHAVACNCDMYIF